MHTNQILNNILLGGLLGLIGQGARTVVGLKKTYSAANQNQQSFKDVFNWGQLLVSLLIGFIAGSLATLAMLDFSKQEYQWSKETVTGLLATGYAGTDFIEGFMKKYLPTDDKSTKNLELVTKPADIFPDVEEPALG